jgi:hypothetical protein
MAAMTSVDLMMAGRRQRLCIRGRATRTPGNPCDAFITPESRREIDGLGTFA